eukprot:941433_1
MPGSPIRAAIYSSNRCTSSTPIMSGRLPSPPISIDLTEGNSAPTEPAKSSASNSTPKSASNSAPKSASNFASNSAHNSASNRKSSPPADVKSEAGRPEWFANKDNSSPWGLPLPLQKKLQDDFKDPVWSKHRRFLSRNLELVAYSEPFVSELSLVQRYYDTYLTSIPLSFALAEIMGRDFRFVDSLWNKVDQMKDKPHAGKRIIENADIDAKKKRLSKLLSSIGKSDFAKYARILNQSDNNESIRKALRDVSSALSSKKSKSCANLRTQLAARPRSFGAVTSYNHAHRLPRSHGGAPPVKSRVPEEELPILVGGLVGTPAVGNARNNPSFPSPLSQPLKRVIPNQGEIATQPPLQLSGRMSTDTSALVRVPSLSRLLSPPPDPPLPSPTSVAPAKSLMPPPRPKAAAPRPQASSSMLLNHPKPSPPAPRPAKKRVRSSASTFSRSTNPEPSARKSISDSRKRPRKDANFQKPAAVNPKRKMKKFVGSVSSQPTASNKEVSSSDDDVQFISETMGSSTPSSATSTDSTMVHGFSLNPPKFSPDNKASLAYALSQPTLNDQINQRRPSQSSRSAKPSQISRSAKPSKSNQVKRQVGRKSTGVTGALRRASQQASVVSNPEPGSLSYAMLNKQSIKPRQPPIYPDIYPSGFGYLHNKEMLSHPTGLKLPTKWKYVTKHLYHSSVGNKPDDSGDAFLVPCNCTSRCSAKTECSCLHDKQGDVRYKISEKSNAKPIGILDISQCKGRPSIVVECNKKCACRAAPLKCPNRVVQLSDIGSKKLVVHYYGKKGWGLKATAPYEKGEYVCSYVGEMISESEAVRREAARENDSEPLFLWSEKRDLGGIQTCTIDASSYGNLSRFANHSCDPNMISCQVLYDSYLQFPKIGFFVSRRVQKGEELTINYHWDEHSFDDAVSSPKRIRCLCGSRKCAGWMRVS